MDCGLTLKEEVIIFLQNVGNYLQDYIVSQPKETIIHIFTTIKPQTLYRPRNKMSIITTSSIQQRSYYKLFRSPTIPKT
jgi:hypothetical protein